MARNKYDFIEDLLANKNLNINQRERILRLASKEISFEGSLEERIQKIEEIIKTESPNGNSLEPYKPLKAESSTLPKYRDPYFTYKYLFEYNQNPILRSTCHDIDSEELKHIIEYCGTDAYDFKAHLIKIRENFDLHDKNFFASKKVKGLIRGYLTGKDYLGNLLKRGWSDDGVHINWSSLKISDWASKNPGIPPNSSITLFRKIKGVKSFKIEPQIKTSITDRVIQTFPQLVIHFKNLFHLKSGEQSLHAILQRENNAKKWEVIVDFEITDEDFPKNIEHFTDVDSLRQAYNSLINIIIKQHEVNNKKDKPRVKLRFFEDKKKVSLSIHHCNGRYNKTIQSLLDRRDYGRDYNNLINLQINGLCNLYLKADFGGAKFAKINLWNGKSRKVEEELTSFVGVEHILEFPKIKEL